MHNSQEYGTPSQQYDELRRGKLFYTVKEVVATGLCSRQTLWRLMRAGEIGYVKVGTRVLIPREELLGFVRSHYHGSDLLNASAVDRCSTPGDVALGHALPLFLRAECPSPHSAFPRKPSRPRHPTRKQKPQGPRPALGGTTLAQAARESRHP